MDYGNAAIALSALGRGIGVTVFVNWRVKPFSMALLGWLFVRQLFAPRLPAEQIDSDIAGLILLAAAPCTAMVFVWSNLCDGEPAFTLSQVALNDLIMVFAFAPVVGLLLGLSSIAVRWGTLLVSVALYIVAPVIIAALLRHVVLARGGEMRLQAVLRRLGPISLGATASPCCWICCRRSWTEPPCSNAFRDIAVQSPGEPAGRHGTAPVAQRPAVADAMAGSSPPRARATAHHA